MHALSRSSPAPAPDAGFEEVRKQSEALCAPLETDDYQVQSVIDASPPKWHLAHVTWFFETFLLKPFLPGYQPLDARYERLFNSYYNTVGPFHPRAQRHTLSRPTVPEVYAYRAHVDDHMAALVARCPAAHRATLQERLTLGLHHEQQHQELLLMDIKRNFFANPLYPAYAAQRPAHPGDAPVVQWLEYPGGIREVGYNEAAFSFDNELPRHKVFLRDYRLASRPVTNGEYLEFVDAGGYAKAELWLSDGWSTVRERRWQTPLYWTKIDGAWHEMTLSGMRPLEPAAPACHLS